MQGAPIFQIGFTLFKALLLAVAVLVYGSVLMGVLDRDREKVYLPAAFAVGLIFTSFYFYLAAFFKVLTAPVIVAYYVLAAVLLVFEPRRTRRAQSPLRGWFFSRRWIQWFDFFSDLGAGQQRWWLLYPVFFLPLIYSLLPPSFYDSLVYHLGIPNFYLQQGGFVATPQFLFANTSIYYEISLIPAVFAGETVPRAFHFLVGVIFILAAADFGKEHFHIKNPSVFITAALAMPMSVFLLSTVKNDLVSALFILLGIRYLLKDQWHLSGLFWGFALGVKYFNALPLILFVLVFLISKKYFPFKKLLPFGLITAAMLVPLWVKNFIYCGNPVFPFLSAYFPTPFWDASRYALMASDVGKMFHSVSEALTFPYTLSFHHSGFGGMVGAQFLMFLPLLLIVKKAVKIKWSFLVFAVVTLYVGGLFTGSVRFLFIVFIIFTFYLTIVYEGITIKFVKYLFWAVMAFNLILSLSLQEQLYRSFNFYSGILNSESYKAAMFPTYPAIDFANRHLTHTKEGDAHKIMLVGEARNYYLTKPYVVASGLDYSILKKYLIQSTDYNQFLQALKSDGFGYIILNSSEFNRLQQTRHRLNPQELLKANTYFQMLHQNNRIVFRHKSLAVFDLN